MAITAAGLNIAADALGGAATHVGLVDDLGAEIAGGTYARQPVAWTAAADGLIRPTTDETFDIPAGVTVGGWRGYSALSLGTDYGGAALTNETYANAGTYTLLAASTSYDFNAV
jgi:hypothetical protein